MRCAIMTRHGYRMQNRAMQIYPDGASALKDMTSRDQVVVLPNFNSADWMEKIRGTKKGEIKYEH